MQSHPVISIPPSMLMAWLTDSIDEQKTHGQ
jgi:hypothetical protein